MNGYIQRSKGDFANGTPTHRQARGHGPCPAHGQENREDQGSTKDDSRGMRGIGQDSQKSDSEPRRRRRLYVSEDGTRCDTDTALEREWKSGAEASFRSDRNSGSALGARHDTEHEAGRRGKTRSRKVFEGKGKKKLKTVAREFKSELTAKATDSEKAFADILINAGIKYKFQNIFKMGNTFSIVDFFLPDYATVVEIDGGYHNTTEQSAKDEARTRDLLKRHVNIVRVVRFKNEELSLGTDYVLRKMARAIIPWIKWEL